MKPDFTDEENFVIAFYRDRKASSASRLNLLDAARVLVAIGFFVYGFINGDMSWSVVGFGILLFGEARKMIETSKYMRVFRSIFAKYDEAVGGGESPHSNSEQD